MGSKTLHVFNPEHDLALAVGRGPYTPPAEVKKIRKIQSLLPALYADSGDFILRDADIKEDEIKSLPYYSLAKEKAIRIINPSEIVSITQDIGRVMPWGWDHALRRSLEEAGVSNNLLPSEESLDKLRELSHRRTTILFRNSIAHLLSEEVINPPIELSCLEEVIQFLEFHPLSYFKAPWSSSGRGIVVSDHISRKGLLEWAHGIIRRQGSVIAEPSWNRVFDFATEWRVTKGTPEFLGYSVFKTSSRGKYHGNVEASQSELLDTIKKNAPRFRDEIISAQKHALQSNVAPWYEGPLGIDMLADSEGNINPCVEINLRITMGMIGLLKS